MKAIVFDKNKLQTISDVCEQTGIHQQTLRNWDRLGLLHPERIGGNQRVYQKKDLCIIEDIIKLKLAGIKNIEDIRQVLVKKYQLNVKSEELE